MRSSTAPFLFVLFITAQAKRIRSSSLPGIESRWNHEHLEPLADLGLTSLIQRHPVHDSEAYSQALHVIKSMESAPSCNRLATFTLIDSCRSLEGQNDKLDDDSSIELDQVKSTFAARLAICELISAHADVPDHCLSLVPQVIEPLHHKIRCFFPGSQYELLELHRDLNALHSSTGKALSESLRRANHHAADYESFLRAARESQKSVLQEAKRRFSLFVNDIERRFTEMLGRTWLEAEETSVKMQNLNIDLAESVHEAAAVRQEIVKTGQEIRDRQRDASEQYAKDLRMGHDHALASQHEVARKKDEVLASLATSFAELRNELYASSQLTDLIYAQQANQDMWLSQLETAIQRLHFGAESLQKLQDGQLANQTAMLDDLKLRIEATEGAIKTNLDGLGRLATAIDQQTSLITALGVFSGIDGAMKGLILIAIVACLAYVSPKISALAVAFLGSLYLLETLLFPRISSQDVLSHRILDWGRDAKLRATLAHCMVTGAFILAFAVVSSIILKHYRSRTTEGHDPRNKAEA